MSKDWIRSMPTNELFALANERMGNAQEFQRLASELHTKADGLATEAMAILDELGGRCSNG